MKNARSLAERQHTSLFSNSCKNGDYSVTDQNISLQQKLHSTQIALKEVQTWIRNWSPKFTEDPEWKWTKERIDAALKGVEI